MEEQQPNIYLHSNGNTTEQWPPQANFPICWPRKPHKQQVYPILSQDLESSDGYYIITGFTSLAFIVQVFGTGTYKPAPERDIKVMLGFEQEMKQRVHWRPKISLDQAIKEYWLDQDFSIVHGGMLMRTIKLLEEGSWLRMRILNDMHSKIYVGDNHAVLGSSNFSVQGTRSSQIESNIRVAKNGDEFTERQQYARIELLAQRFWEHGEPYNHTAIELLKGKLKPVDWEEALARGIAELRREWDDELVFQRLEPPLWPHQRQGVAEALTILDTYGNVLIADPAGSGKTRMVSALCKAQEQRMRAHGQIAPQLLIVAPPLVKRKWIRDLREQGWLNAPFLSSGQLSHLAVNTENDIVEAKKQLSKAQLLVLDEAHHYHSRKSLRSQLIASHACQHLIMATATPLNRHANDLLRLIELLDVDNLTDKEIVEYSSLRRLRYSELHERHLEQLRGFVQRFILRRSRGELRYQIKENPEGYVRKGLRTCNYPKHQEYAFKTGESEKDQQIAQKILAEAKNLVGLIYLKSLMPDPGLPLDTDDARRQYLKRRFDSAPQLAVFMIQQRLRSSRAALCEHIEGYCRLPHLVSQ